MDGEDKKSKTITERHPPNVKYSAHEMKGDSVLMVKQPSFLIFIPSYSVHPTSPGDPVREWNPSTRWLI